MNDNHHNANNAANTGNASTNGSTTYIYESGKTTNDMRASYEKELGMHMDMMKPSMGGGRRPKLSGNSARTMLASFLIGAVVIGGFSYMADKNNLFSGGAAANEDAGTSIASGAQTEDAGLTTASLGTSDDIATIYEAASPAVVKIETYAEPARSESMFDDPAFRQFFGGEYGRGGQSPQQEEQQESAELALTGSGTGFFFESDGYILTNEHVIADAKEVKVTVQGYDEPLTAAVMGSSYELDLAVLKVESPDGKAFPSLELGSSDETQIGDWVIAIGNPYGFDQTLTMGVLSAKERPITIADEQGEHQYEHLLQTDASINPGNSGGPLLNEEGEVIGINTAVNAEAQGIGFAIPTTTIAKVLEQLKTNTL
ncbi:S1C family serine protease [Paenibacillus arenilitoris]|nr:trypsin-like peptidase domain-containing protein [Paenibacillus arenilitoris]